MAYNPFNIFRRNQKALFAVLTVFVMIVFTLSSGVAGGDFFETFSRWLGAGRGSSEPVAKIDGSTVTMGDLEGPRGVQFKRVMANRFMSLAARHSVQTLEANITDKMSRATGEGKQAAAAALGLANAWRAGQLNPSMVDFIRDFAQRMGELINSPNTKSETKEVAREAQLMALLIHNLALGDSSHYFVNAPNKTRRDLVEFVLWEKKADQLGIKFTTEDVKKLITNEFYGSFKSDVEVRKQMKDTQGYTYESCIDAIGTEFKVRAAQAAVMGQQARFYRVPSFSTPYEAFEFYREQCSPATYEVIGVPAAAFVDQVTAEPSEQELRDLYRRYENVEPDPKSETPGFKDPRKISVAYLGITGEEPYYKKRAEEQIKIGEKMAQVSGLLTVPLPGATGTWAAGAVAPMTIKDPAVAAAYDMYTSQFKFQLRNEYSSSSLLARDVLPSSVVKPGVLAATLGGFLGQTAGHGSPVTAVSVSMAAPIAYEIRDRVKVGMPVMLGLTPGPAMLPTLISGTATGAFYEPKPLPIDYMRPELLEKTINERAKVLAFGDPRGRMLDKGSPERALLEQGDVNRFIEELKKLAPDGKPKDKAAVEKYIQDFIATRGLTHFGKSTAPRDEWTLEDDPALLPLVLAQKDSLRQAGNFPGSFHRNEYIPFGQSFFWRSVFDQQSFQMRRGPATSGLYQAETYPPQAREERPGQPKYIVWRTEDIAPTKTLRMDTAIQSGVVRAAWKRMKARELAQDRANQLAEAVRAYPNNSEFAISQFLADKSFELQRSINEPKVRQETKLFTLNGVCPLVPSTNPLAALRGGGGLEPFTLKESENIPFPTTEMRKELLENRDKPPKTVFVLPNASKDIYYVFTLVRRDMKTTTEFLLNVHSPRGNARDILDLFRVEASNKARQSVVELLKKEFRYEETEEQKKKLDENAKSGGRD